MIFYTTETYTALAIAALPALASVFVMYMTERKQLAWWMLILSCLALRIVAIMLDPYLHEWDERFHALVAKNMMNYPFKPMLRVESVYEIPYKSWCCNHIWLHKQPLFMWQMALSMKFFGVNELAIRIPLVIIGTIMPFFIRGIARHWTKDENIAYVAVLLYVLSSFHLRWTSCRVGMDHNDISFAFYVTGSIWAFSKYADSKTLKWAICVGLFVGGAVLSKWLTGLLVYSGWGLFTLLSRNERKKFKHYVMPFISLLVAGAVFLPWQIYISYRFPLESAWEYAYNTKHFLEVIEGHKGDFWFHFNSIDDLYGGYFIPFLILGLLVLIGYKPFRKGSLAYLSMLVILYLFFSIAATKLLGYIMPGIGLMYIVFATGIVSIFYGLLRLFPIVFLPKLLFPVLLIVMGFHSLRPSILASESSKANDSRNAKIHNTKIFKRFRDVVPNQYIVIFNVHQEVELMFYQPVMAYNWYPNEQVMGKIKEKHGGRIAIFKNHGIYGLSDWLLKDSTIYRINLDLKG